MGKLQNIASPENVCDKMTVYQENTGHAEGDDYFSQFGGKGVRDVSGQFKIDEVSGRRMSDYSCFWYLPVC